MRIKYFGIPIFSALILLCTACTTLTTRVENEPGRETHYEDPDTPGKVKVVDIESQDIISLTDKMMRDILANPFWVTKVSPGEKMLSPRIIVDKECFKNQGASDLNLNMITDRLRVELTRAAKGRMVFLARHLAIMVEKERVLKDQGIVTQDDSSKKSLPLGADYRLCGNITTLDKISGDKMSRFTQITMEFVNLTTGVISWSGIYSFRKVGERPENIDRGLDIQIWTDQSIYRVGENLYVHFRSSADCYLYMYHQSADGNTQLIFPNLYGDSNFIRGGQIYTIPNDSYGFNFTVSPPVGLENIKVMATTRPEHA